MATSLAISLSISSACCVFALSAPTLFAASYDFPRRFFDDNGRAVDILDAVYLIERGQRLPLRAEPIEIGTRVDSLTDLVENDLTASRTPEVLFKAFANLLVHRIRSTNARIRFANCGFLLRSSDSDCVGAATLYLMIGRRMNLDLQMAEEPGHAFVVYRYEGEHYRIDPFLRDAPEQIHYSRFDVLNTLSGKPRLLDDRETIAILLWKSAARNVELARHHPDQRFRYYEVADRDINDAIDIAPHLGSMYIVRAWLNISAHHDIEPFDRLLGELQSAPFKRYPPDSALSVSYSLQSSMADCIRAVAAEPLNVNVWRSSWQAACVISAREW